MFGRWHACLPIVQPCVALAGDVRLLTASCACAQRLKSELSAPDYEYDAGLRDQNGIVYQLKRDGARALSRVKLVNWGYCLNCYWRDLQGRDNFTYSDEQARPPALAAPLHVTAEPWLHSDALTLPTVP